jgi:hypothetical protein
MKLKKYRVEAKQQFEQLLLKTTNEFTQDASKVLDRKIIIAVKRQDQLRLLNLLTWRDKFNLPVSEILAVVLKVWGNKYKGRNPKGLGVAISTICGPKSKQIIKEYIKKQYPNGECIELRKQELLNTLLPTIDVKRREDPLAFIKDYKNYIKMERKKIDDIEEKLKRRHWRTNPVF